MDEWGLGDLKMDMRNRTVEGLEHILADVIERADTAEFKQMTVSAFQYGIALHNPTMLERWQAQLVPYPGALGQAMVRENLRLDAWCWWVELLAKRGDLPLVYSALSEVTEKILAMLIGLNHIYHPGFKWMHRLIDDMVVAPERLRERIQQAFQAEPLAALSILRDLMVETYDLIDSCMPEVETAEARSAFLHQRSQVAVMPETVMRSIHTIGEPVGRENQPEAEA
jgi:Domain of unknown function (DUF4037)